MLFRAESTNEPVGSESQDPTSEEVRTSTEIFGSGEQATEVDQYAYLTGQSVSPRQQVYAVLHD